MHPVIPVLAILLVLTVALNIWRWRDRSKMYAVDLAEAHAESEQSMRFGDGLHAVPVGTGVSRRARCGASSVRKMIIVEAYAPGWVNL